MEEESFPPFRFYYKRSEFRYPIIVEYRTVFSDINVTRWKHWNAQTSELPDSFVSIEDAIRQIEIVYGPITRTGYSSNLYTFETDNDFQIRFINIEQQFNDEFPDREPVQTRRLVRESPWKIDFAKELEK